MLRRNEGVTAIEGVEMAAAQARPLDPDHTIDAAAPTAYQIAAAQRLDSALTSVGHQHPGTRDETGTA